MDKHPENCKCAPCFLEEIGKIGPDQAEKFREIIAPVYPSYHDDIIGEAQKIERERAKTYVIGPGTDANSKSAMTRRPSAVLTEAENLYLEAAHYKITRAWHFTQSKVKMLDDLMDAYNFTAMAYNELKKNAGLETAK